ncbi:fumarylacetoacetate hydrolase family protein [Burkholderia gladioli]|uniref:fumarylacetoacetate hydrolase family protein n=1 Tax=Burkholderia gladioli TaxID=28095 RepID=UPI002880A8CD|nr:fumarylacetoacetate hydrolase family protein [Burkholderia gladioli]
MNLTAAGLPDSLDALLHMESAGMQAARQALERRGVTVSTHGLRYLPPISTPSKVFAIGLNYIDHAAESNFAPPKYPVIFSRYPSSWVAHDEPIVRPHVSTQFDYEAELVVVVGKAGRYISKEAALDHVAGYSVFNEGSIRDFQLRTNQWTIGKTFDSSGAFGPELVTADELPAGAKGLRISCRLNGVTMQDANTADMIFDVATLIAACSEAVELQPGDIIISGTPSGVGLARDPQVWMKPGDVCEIEIEGVGLLRNRVVDEERNTRP